jgi:osmoprotectant transport system ATP-binding protein
VIEFDRVTRRFADHDVVADVSLRVAAGELVALVGGSGAGKTTLLRMVNRLLDPTAGRVCVDTRPTLELEPVLLRRSIGYVIQAVGLFPHMTVERNLAVVPKLASLNRPDRDRRVDELLERVELEPRVHRSRLPRQLSGGQQQRVGIARALASEPRIMLMDEPFGALDPVTRDSLRRYFDQLRRKLRLTTILVTHDMAEALVMADRIAVMDAGRIVQVGTPHELLSAPANDLVRRLIESPLDQARRVGQLLGTGGQP